MFNADSDEWNEGRCLFEQGFTLLGTGHELNFSYTSLLADN
jgi:hypothetical protein